MEQNKIITLKYRSIENIQIEVPRLKRLVETEHSTRNI